MNKKWQKKEVNPEKIKYISSRLNISPEIATILYNRGIDTVEKAFYFIEEGENIISPFLIENMHKAISMINEISQKDKPKVFTIGDKDVDGITGISILLLLFKELGFTTIHDLPLENESYGISERIFENIKRENPDLVVTVDIGIKENEFFDKINLLGIKSIITDHHEIPDVLPNATVIINPKMKNNKELTSLSGAAVAYKLCFATIFSRTEYYNRIFLIKDDKNIDSSIILNNLIDISFKDKKEFLEFIKDKVVTTIGKDKEGEINIISLYNTLSNKNYKTLEQLARNNNVYYTKNAENKTIATLFKKYIKEKLFSQNKILRQALIYACLGNVCDYMPFNTIENRTIIKEGISLINRMKPEQIKITTKKDNIDIKDISLTIGPLLNSSGRLGNANISLEFITEENTEKIYSIYQVLTEINKKRKTIEEEAYKDAISYLQNLSNKNILIYYSDKIIKGITGIIATKVSKRYEKTSFIFYVDKNNKEVVGSGRTILNINMINLLNDCKDIFVRFGGHKKACGMTIDINNFTEFLNIMEEKDNKLQDYFESEFYYRYDIEINPRDINYSILKYIEKLEPFGPEYEEPIFRSYGVHPIEVTKIGQDMDHLKFKVKENPEINFLWWNKSSEYDNIKRSTADVFYYLSLNTYNNRRSIDAYVIDLHII